LNPLNLSPYLRLFLHFTNVTIRLHKPIYNWQKTKTKNKNLFGDFFSGDLFTGNLFTGDFFPFTHFISCTIKLIKLTWKWWSSGRNGLSHACSCRYENIMMLHLTICYVLLLLLLQSLSADCIRLGFQEHKMISEQLIAAITLNFIPRLQTFNNRVTIITYLQLSLSLSLFMFTTILICSGVFVWFSTFSNLFFYAAAYLDPFLGKANVYINRVQY